MSCLISLENRYSLRLSIGVLSLESQELSAVVANWKWTIDQVIDNSMAYEEACVPDVDGWSEWSTREEEEELLVFPLVWLLVGASDCCSNPFNLFNMNNSSSNIPRLCRSKSLKKHFWLMVDKLILYLALLVFMTSSISSYSITRFGRYGKSRYNRRLRFGGITSITCSSSSDLPTRNSTRKDSCGIL